MKHINIPIFIQHMGCPNQCVFCDQHAISGAHSFSFEKVRADIESVLATAGDSECEIAFFGGSFTGIDRGLMIKLLDIAEGYVKEGRVSGIRMSTRPDYISREITDILHGYTVSQVELGIQSFSDKVLEASVRGHSTEASYNAMRLLRAEGFSVVGQMMTGLPGADIETERETARIICNEGAAAARIYPCVVFKNTPLEQMTKRGEYIPMTVDEAVERSAAAYRVFLENGVALLKIGLHESENLHSDDTYFAGPNHPAIGELIRGKIYCENILKALENEKTEGRELTVFVPRGAVSMATGQKRCYKENIVEKTGVKSLKILEKESLSQYNISIDLK
ncbi:MAG: radical SAM protein [Ruminococcaceae bacterium]|nr:radical SAM protein [Oscillospiraceae bacterium]